jgi:hypothetical protein
MTESKRRNLIKGEIFKSYVLSGQEDKEKIQKIIIDDLANSEYQTEDIVIAIRQHRTMSRYAPHLSDIVQIVSAKYEELRKKKIAQNIDEKWIYFQSNAFQPAMYLPYELEAWAVKIKRLIGNSRVEKCENKDLQWIKKEFESYCERLERGELDMDDNLELIGCNINKIEKKTGDVDMVPIGLMFNETN